MPRPLYHNTPTIHRRLSQSIAQHTTGSLLATATIAIFLRLFVPRMTISRGHRLYRSPTQLTSTNNVRTSLLPLPLIPPLRSIAVLCQQIRQPDDPIKICNSIFIRLRAIPASQIFRRRHKYLQFGRLQNLILILLEKVDMLCAIAKNGLILLCFAMSE